MASSRRKKRGRRDTGYRAALVSARGLITVLMYLLVIIFVVYLGRTAYLFGYDIFNETSVTEAPGEDVTVLIPRDSSARQIGQILSDKGLIEDVNVFVVQERISNYHNKLLGGTYILNTSQTPTEMMAILARVNTEGQLEQEDEASEDGGNEN
jgi:UPF0755 protein